MVEVDVHAPDLSTPAMLFVDASSGVFYETMADVESNTPHSPETRMTFQQSTGSGYWRAPAMTGQVVFRASIGASIEERTVTVQ